MTSLPELRCWRRTIRRLAGRRSASGGFTYLGLLFLITLMGLVAALAGSTWSFTGQRDKERELLFVGREYGHAIESYRQAHAGQPQPFPTSLEQLLADPKGLVMRRHLRRLYADPMTGRNEWGLVRSPQGGIVGLYSLSERVPVRHRGVHADDGIDIAKAKTYRDWVFRAVPRSQVPPGTPSAAAVRSDEGAPPLRWEDFPARPAVN